MTPSEPAAAHEPAPRVHAAGHLHPGMLFVRFADGLRQSILPILVSVVAQEVWLAVAAGVFFVLGLVHAVARYLTFQYRLTDEELVTTEGILHRQERRIPIDRIQDLSFESTLLRRVLQLVVVQVETASGQGAEARLDSLSRGDAARLREVLFRLRGRSGMEGASGEAVPAPRVLFRSTGGELALLGFTNNRVGASLLMVLGVFELAEQLGLQDAFQGVLGGVVDRLSAFGTTWTVLFFVAVLFLVMLVGWLVAIAASLVMFHRFELSERDDVLYRRFGLITTRAQSLPRRKIQRITLEAAPLRRLFGAAVVRADSAGAGAQEAQRGSNQVERDILVPLTSAGRARALVAWVLPGLDPAHLAWRRVSPKVVVRVGLKGLILGLLGLGAGLPTIGWPAWLALGAPVLAVAMGVLLFANLAYARSPGHLAFRHGLLGQYLAFVPVRKVQGAVLRAGPIERLFGLAHVTVFVAGGSPTTLGNLPRGEAEALVRDVAVEAAAARFVW
ncbi:MAG: PH domain-containing protein [Planctomycetota bacterium]